MGTTMSVRPAIIPVLPLVLLPQLGTLTTERQVDETRKDHAVEILESLKYHLSASFTKCQAACTRDLDTRDSMDAHIYAPEIPANSNGSD
jgi:hypothetical protein